MVAVSGTCLERDARDTAILREARGSEHHVVVATDRHAKGDARVRVRTGVLPNAIAPTLKGGKGIGLAFEAKNEEPAAKLVNKYQGVLISQPVWYSVVIHYVDLYVL